MLFFIQHGFFSNDPLPFFQSLELDSFIFSARVPKNYLSLSLSAKNSPTCGDGYACPSGHSAKALGTICASQACTDMECCDGIRSERPWRAVPLLTCGLIFFSLKFFIATVSIESHTQLVCGSVCMPSLTTRKSRLHSTTRFSFLLFLLSNGLLYPIRSKAIFDPAL